MIEPPPPAPPPRRNQVADMICCGVTGRERLHISNASKPAADPSFTRLGERGFSPDDGPAPSICSAPLILIVFLFPALAGFNFGFDIGSTGGAIQQLRAVPDAAALNTSPLLQGLLTSGSLFGALLGTLLSFAAAGPLGRRGELLLASVLYLLGTLLCFFAPTGENMLRSVFLGRGVYGIGVAFAMHAAPVYIAEIAPPAIRGLLISLKEGFIVGGILAGFSASALCIAAGIPADTAWRLIWLTPAGVAGLVGTGMALVAPESPRWLLLRAMTVGGTGPPPTPSLHQKKQQYLDDARLALRRLRAPGLWLWSFGARPPFDEDTEVWVEAELGGIQEMVIGTEGADAEAGCAEVLQARKALIAGLGLVLLQQVTGQPSVLYYQETIFRDAGFGEMAAYASVIVGAAKLCATMFTVLQVENYGRRPLLFAGIFMMLVSLVVLAYSFFHMPIPPNAHGGTASALDLGAQTSSLPAESNLAAIAIVCSLMVYVCGYQIGFGPIAWLLISEIFPLRTRGTALSIAVTVNFAFNLLVTFTLPSIQDAFDAIEPGRGIAYLFIVYATLCLFSLVFVHAYVPETKGKTLEQIEKDLKQ